MTSYDTFACVLAVGGHTRKQTVRHTPHQHVMQCMTHTAALHEENEHYGYNSRTTHLLLQ